MPVLPKVDEKSIDLQISQSGSRMATEFNRNMAMRDATNTA